MCKRGSSLLYKNSTNQVFTFTNSELVYFKGDPRLKFQPCFYDVFLLNLCRKSLVQSFIVLWSQSHEVTKFKIGVIDAMPPNLQNISTGFYGETSNKVLGCFWSFFVTTFWFFKLCPNIIDVILTNEHAWYSYCDFLGIFGWWHLVLW